MITDEADLPVAAEEVLCIGLLEAALVDDYCRRVLRFRCRDASRPVFHPLVGIGKAAVHEAGSGGGGSTWRLRRPRWPLPSEPLFSVLGCRRILPVFGASSRFSRFGRAPSDQDGALAEAVLVCPKSHRIEAVGIVGGRIADSIWPAVILRHEQAR